MNLYNNEKNKKTIISVLLMGLVIVGFIFIPNWDNWDNMDNDPNETDPLMSVIFPLNDILNYNTSYFPPYEFPNLNFTPRITPSSIEPGLSNVDFQGYSLPATVISQLEQYGFALVGNTSETLRDIYDYEENLKPKFITADFCLHAYHKLYDNYLKYLETEYFANYFTYMLKSIQSHQLSLIEDDMDIKIKSAIKRNVAYVSVMLNLLNSTEPIPEIVQSMVNDELDNINSTYVSDSSIFGYKEDFNQYVPRGHYTKSELLKNYFKAMMYAGRMTFKLQDFNNMTLGIALTRSALILLDSLDVVISKFTGWHCWEHINSIMGFFVGDSDDLTPLEYYQIWKEFDFPKANDLVNDSLIDNIIEKLQLCRKPKINSMIVDDHPDIEIENETQGMRLFGQKFTPDSFIFQELTHDKVPDRFMPSGLDIFSVFGSEIAADLQSENSAYAEYDSQVHALKEYFANLTDEEWTENLYSSWIYGLQSLLRSNYTGYPGFMQNDAWKNRVLMGTMGSWAELRHDTILYAKQSYSVTWGDWPQWHSGGYVEPNPEPYARLAALSNQTFNGLEERGMDGHGFDSLSSIFKGLSDISIKELENIPLSSDDYQFIDTVGQSILNIMRMYLDEGDDSNDRMGIIADVHTDTLNYECLEVGTGDPLIIYAIVQDSNGNLRLTKGATYSYYEFNHSMFDRLTDERWLEMLDGNDPPIMPSWITSTIPIVFL